MTNKHEVLAAIAAHPDWGSSRLGRFIGCESAYVRATAQRNGITLPHDPHGRAGGRPRIYDWDEVLRLWAAGLSAPEVARRMRKAGYAYVYGVVHHARKQGEPRAVRRQGLSA